MGPEGGSSLVLTGLGAYRDRVRRTAMVVLILSVLALSVFGIVMLYSTSAAIYGEKLLIKQAQWIGVGILAATFVYFVDYRWLARYRVPLLILTALPLAYLAGVHVLSTQGVSPAILNRFPLVRNVNGAYRWLFIGSISVQPGELAKLAIVLFLATYYGANPRWATQFKRGLFRPLMAVGPVVGLILLGGSLSITVITGAVVLILLFVAGVRLRYFLILGLSAALLVLLVLIMSTSRLKRVTESWFNPE
jgi:cell division protein FtsW